MFRFEYPSDVVSENKIVVLWDVNSLKSLKSIQYRHTLPWRYADRWTYCLSGAIKKNQYSDLFFQESTIRNT